MYASLTQHDLAKTFCVSYKFCNLQMPSYHLELLDAYLLANLEHLYVPSSYHFFHLVIFSFGLTL